MKLKLSTLVTIANLVTIDDREVCGLYVNNEPNTVRFDLADETTITLLNSKVEFVDEATTFEVATDDGMTAVCKFFTCKSMKMSDVADFMIAHDDEDFREQLYEHYGQALREAAK